MACSPPSLHHYHHHPHTSTAPGSRHRSLTMFDSFFARVGEAAATPPDYIKVRAATAAPAALLNLAAR